MAILGVVSQANAQTGKLAVSLVNANISGNPPSTTYQAQTYFPAITLPTKSALVVDQSGNLYDTYVGQNYVQQILPNGTLGMQWAGLNVPKGIVVDKDGSGLLVGTSSGLMHLGFDGSETLLNSNGDIGWPLYSPSGVLYAFSSATNAIYQISDTGVASVYVAGGVISNLQGISFNPAGNMIAVNYNTNQIVQINPDLSLTPLLSIASPEMIVPYGQGWLVGTASGTFLVNGQWQMPTKLVSTAATGAVVLPNGEVILAVWGAAGYTQLVATPATSTQTGFNNVSMNSPGNMLLSASVLDTLGSVSNVQFFSGTTLLGTAAQAPYTLNWNNIAAGTYSVTATATDSSGAASTSAPINFTVAAVMQNQTVSFAALANQIMGAAPLTLNATASSGLPVTFTSSTPSVCTVSGSMATLVTAGTCTIVANQAGNNTYSIAPQITQSFVISNILPIVTLSNSSAGQSYTAPATVTLSATATSSTATIAQVAFYNGTSLIGTATQAPYSVNWAHVISGTYNVTAVATDSLGNTAISAPLPVSVASPLTVNLISPSSGQTLLAPATLTLAAAATDAAGTITQVAFYNGTSLMATVTQAPYSIALPNSVAGTYNVTAQATDSLGLTAISSAVTITVAPATAVTVSLVNTSFNGNPPTTTYQTQPYLPAITLTTRSALVVDQSGNLYDTYIGQSHVQQILPNGTLGMQWAGLNTPKGIVVDKDGSGLLVGTSSGLMHLGFDGSETLLNTNGDIGWPMYSPSGVLFAYSSGTNTIYQITDAGVASVYIASGVISNLQSINFNAAGNMIVANYNTNQILQINPDLSLTPLLSIASPEMIVPYGQRWLVGTANGTYLVDAQWQTPTKLVSTAATSAVVLPNGKVILAVWGAAGYTQLVAVPAVTAASGFNNLTISPPASMMLSANVLDTLGTVSNVQFYNGATLLGTATQAPYTLNWNNIAAGTYNVTAIATDSTGVISTSAPINLTVVALSSQTINFSGPSSTAMGAAPITLTATSSAGLAVTFTSISTAVCTVSGSTVTLVSVGTCLIAADQAGNSSYMPAPEVMQSFAITQGMQNIGFAAPVGISFGTPVALSATASSGLPITYVSNTTSVCTVNGTVLNVIGIGTCTISAYQAGNGNYDAAVQVTQSFVIAAQSQVITFAPPPDRVLITNQGELYYPLVASTNAGLPVTFTSLTPTQCVVVGGNTINLDRVGTCTIVANQAGNGDVGPAPSVTQSFAVLPYVMPAITLTSPVAGQSWTAPTSITMTAAVTSSMPIAYVQFVGTNSTTNTYSSGKVTQAPYSFTWANVPAGNIRIQATVIDSVGGTASTVPVTVTSNPITLSLSSPSAGTRTAPTKLVLAATATDSTGKITQVAFLNGTTLMGTITQPPYTITIPDAEVGTYAITAQASDNAGFTATSNLANVAVVPGTGTGGTGTGVSPGVEQAYDIHTDQLNTPRLITDSNGNAVWQWDSTDPFGDNLPNQDPNGTGNQFVFNLRFLGQYFDQETSLHHNRRRDYDPATGREIQSDPMGLAGGSASTYSYVGGNPLSEVDPFGYMSKGECKALRDRIYRKNGLLQNELAKYDPFLDGQGGFSMKYGSGFTKPGGHFKEITDLQRGIKSDLANYNQGCKCDENDDDDHSGPPKVAITRNVDALANSPVEAPPNLPFSGVYSEPSPGTSTSSPPWWILLLPIPGNPIYGGL